MEKIHRLLRVISGIMVLFICQEMSVSAQTGEGGLPPSFRYPVATRSGGAGYEEIPVTFHVEDLKRVDEWQAAGGTPTAVGALIDVALSPRSAGEWYTLPGGEKIWQLTLQAKGAIALMLYYSDFYIPEGGKLFLYDTGKTQVLGAYTHNTHPAGGRFATEFVAGDEVTLEYVAAAADSSFRLEIEAVGYGYNHLSAGNGTVSLRASGACEIDINCDEGDVWQKQKKGVCHTVQRIGSKNFICTGVLLNNTAQDLKPYILTAQHCAVDGDNEATSENLEQWVFYFNYERNGCGSQDGIAPAKTMTGCRRMALSETDGGSDGLLVMLTKSIPENYDVFYNGWDRREAPAQSGAGLHNPAGDYMKISTFHNPAMSYTFRGDNSLQGDTNAHWNIIFEETANGHGVTEKGSSGSPLFNENQLVVGSLTGGSSSCTEPDGLNLYGKLSYHSAYVHGHGSHAQGRDGPGKIGRAHV